MDFMPNVTCSVTCEDHGFQIVNRVAHHQQHRRGVGPITGKRNVKNYTITGTAEINAPTTFAIPTPRTALNTAMLNTTFQITAVHGGDCRVLSIPSPLTACNPELMFPGMLENAIPP